jgi:hypothetical protein
LSSSSLSRATSIARGDSPADGSSRSGSLGPVTNALASATSLRWPPRGARALPRALRSRENAHISTAARAGLRRQRAGVDVLGHGRRRKTLSVCGTKLSPRRVRRSAGPGVLLFQRTVPPVRVTGRRPPSQRGLPAPFGPITATIRVRPPAARRPAGQRVCRSPRGARRPRALMRFAPRYASTTLVAANLLRRALCDHAAVVHRDHAVARALTKSRLR